MASQSCIHIGSSDHRQTHYIHLLFHKYFLISTYEKKNSLFFEAMKTKIYQYHVMKTMKCITMTITFSQKNEQANQNTWVEHGLY